jgi:hypothetical protein
VLRAARADAGVFAIGVDTDASGLREASRRAARPARKGGLPNALFLVGEASAALALFGDPRTGQRGEKRIDEVWITLPWGSLLRAVLDGERDFASAVAGSL